MLDVLALIGGVTVFAFVVLLLGCLVSWCRTVGKVARDYKKASESINYVNPMSHIAGEIKELRRRLYKAERDASNTNLHLSQHAKYYKHTKTAKKVAIDKARKKAEQEYQHDADVRGCGDGQ